MDAAAQLRRALEIDLRNALARDEFELHYQRGRCRRRASRAAPRRWCAGAIRAAG